MPSRRTSHPAQAGARRPPARNLQPPTDYSSAKARGELAELIFLHRAAARGFIISKPYGESAPYDFIVAHGPRLSRVQVRSSANLDHGAYRVSTSRGCRSKIAYTPRDIDVLAAYIVPLDLWYLIPVRAFYPAKTICIHPGRPSRFEPFRESWRLFGS